MPFNDGSLRPALDRADVRVLLAVLVHLTGNRRWLEAPYRPSRDTRLIADPSAGLPDDIQKEVRDVMFELLRHGTPVPVIDEPPTDLFVEMMSACLGEPVGDEYVPMMRQEMGFEDAVPSPIGSSGYVDAPRTIIVGGGLAGIAAAARLSQAGAPYIVLEQNDGVGGTWFQNRYPDCGVDTPNHFYSYSFAPNPDWSKYFAPREELLAYIERCVDDFSIRPNIRFQTSVESAVWDEEAQEWEVECATPQGVRRFRGAFLICAVGQLNRPSVPPISGLERFEGISFHSSRWPRDVELDGKRVGVVGAGASAMQLVPRVADVARDLVIFQRSKQWTRPVEKYRASVPPELKLLFRYVPYYSAWYRFTLAWRYGDGLHRTLRRDPAWPHPERSMNKANDRMREELTAYVTAELGGDVELISKVLPSYPPFAKRMLADNGWFSTLVKSHVELVTEPIKEVTARGVVTADGVHHELDVLVLATGFRASEFLGELDVRGRNGRTLLDEWGEDNARAYLGVTIPEFPNFFVLYGPNTNLAHGGSIIFQIECQVRYVLSLMRQMSTGGYATAEVRRSVYDDYAMKVDAEHEELVWSHPAVTSWYRNARGRVIANSPWRLVDYWEFTHQASLDDYKLLRAGMTMKTFEDDIARLDVS